MNEDFDSDPEMKWEYIHEKMLHESKAQDVTVATIFVSFAVMCEVVLGCALLHWIGVI